MVSSKKFATKQCDDTDFAKLQEVLWSFYLWQRGSSVEAKTKAYDTCIELQATYRSCSGAVHVTDSGHTAHRP